MVRELIERKCGITLSVVSVGRLLKKLGLTCQKPLRRAFQRDPVVVEQWIEKEYPKIKRLAQREKAEIYFEDEAGIRSDHHVGTTWAIRGNTPVVRTAGARFSMNMISAITSKGTVRFMTYAGKMKAPVFCEFHKRIIHHVPAKVFLILDGHPVHRSSQVKTFVETIKGKLRLFYLPPYSPELNPDKLVRNNMKGKIGRSSIKGPDDFQDKVRHHLKSLQRTPGMKPTSGMRRSYGALLMTGLITTPISPRTIDKPVASKHNTIPYERPASVLTTRISRITTSPGMNDYFRLQNNSFLSHYAAMSKKT